MVFNFFNYYFSVIFHIIYFKEKDYFNAKATFQSIVDNTINAEFKNEAQTKLNRVIEEEGKSSKVNN